MVCENEEYLLEDRLRQLDPDLHRRFSDTIFSMQHTLNRYQQLLPEFTDHSILHSMTIVDFCNRLIGQEQVLELNADAIYALLMGYYLHDVGMDISLNQFYEFAPGLPLDEYRQQHPNATLANIVRDFHEELSAAFVRKFAEFLEIPSPEHTHAIMQVCRGHRETNLFDQTQFPAHWTVANGNEINLSYLASLVRLADEIDVTSARNPAMLYDSDFGNDHHKMHRAVRSMAITDEALTLYVTPCEAQVERLVDHTVQKLQSTLDLCRTVTAKSSPFVISQERVDLVRIPYEQAS